MPIKLKVIGYMGGNEMTFHRVYMFVIMVMLFIFSIESIAQPEDRSILNESKIKTKSFNKVFRDIKKTLSKESKKCPIEVTDVKLLKSKDGGVAEDWTVSICEETKVYLVTTFHPKGYYVSVIPKEEALAQDIKYWRAAKKFGTEETWRDTMIYIDEIEAMNLDRETSE